MHLPVTKSRVNEIRTQEKRGRGIRKPELGLAIGDKAAAFLPNRICDYLLSQSAQLAVTSVLMPS